MIPAGPPEPATVAADGRQLAGAGAAMLVGAGVWPLLPWSLGVTCPLRRLTGIPCPLCGMTTSVIATVDLRIYDALAANPGGVVAVVVAVALLVRRPAVLSVRQWPALAGLAALWLFELNRFGFLP